MKKFIRIGLSALLFAGFIISCDDDESTPQPVAISFSESAATLDEGQTITGTLTFPAAPVAANVTISLTGNAVYGTDYTTSPAATSGQIVIAIAKGDTQKTISFTSIDNNVFEGDKTLIATLSTDSDLLNVGTISTYNIEIRENDPEPTAITIARSEFPVANGFKIQRASFNNASFPTNLPEGENQTWDLSAIASETPVNLVPYLTFSDATIPDANISLASLTTETITGSELELTALFQVNESGFFEGGLRYTEDTVVPIFGGTGELVFNSGDFLFSPKREIVPFPMEYGYSRTENLSLTQNFSVTYAAAGLNQVPANTVDAVAYTTAVVGWGTLKLPGYDHPFEVLMVKNTRLTTRNYLLGGAPAPAQILAGLGLTDGEQFTDYAYSFYTKQHGQIAWYNIYQGELSRAFFRTDITQ